MISTSDLLLHYKRRDMQEEILLAAKNKEVAIKYGDKGFGSRPDVLKNAADILELAKQGATSFHASEELWKNPLQLDPMMKKNDMDDLRIGWDLVLDIDCPFWELSKVTTWLFIKALRDNGVENISVKFSGNKGFHIGVPFESFPSIVHDKETRLWFPDGARTIAFYLLDYVVKKYIEVIENRTIKFGEDITFEISKLKEMTDKSIEELTKKICSKCHKEFKEAHFSTTTYEYLCPRCNKSKKLDVDEETTACECGFPMENITRNERTEKARCACNNNSFYRIFNPLSIIEVDTILISSRHLYRMPYSLHEKSNLASLPINPDVILNFQKELAQPKNVKISEFRFLDRKKSRKDEARHLFVQAFDFGQKVEEKRMNLGNERDYEAITKALPEEYFPPCIKNISRGLKDGKKRSLFIIVNYLSSVGWTPEKIEEFLAEWNKRNEEQLREVYLMGQLKYHTRLGKKILPPNCSNKMYYEDLRICTPDSLCRKIKNPVNYSIRKARFGKEEEKKSKSF